MKFYTSSSFRESLERLLKKRRDGYMSVVKDICSTLQEMPDNILRTTNDRIRQKPEYRLVKLRLPNSGQHLAKKDGFRLIYLVSELADDLVLLHVYPKRGPRGVVDLLDAEYNRLVLKMIQESQANILHQVDIDNGLEELVVTGSLTRNQ